MKTFLPCISFLHRLDRARTSARVSILAYLVIVIVSAGSSLALTQAMAQTAPKPPSKPVSAASAAVAMSPNDEVFKVLACKGKITLQRTKKPLLVGSALTGADAMKLEGACYLGLVHRSGKAIEHRTAGVVSVAELLKLVPAPQSTLDKLVGFVVESLNESRKRGAKNELSGGVERGTGGILSSAGGAVVPLLPRTSKLDVAGADSVVHFSWTSKKQSRLYAFSLSDAQSVMRFKRELADTTLALNFRELGLNAGSCYYWTVTRVADSTTEAFDPHATRLSYCVYPAKPDEMAELAAEEKELRAQNITVGANIGNNDAENSPLLMMMNAMLYERYGFNARAYSLYASARTTMKRIGGDTATLEAAFEKFLSRIGFEPAMVGFVKK